MTYMKRRFNSMRKNVGYKISFAGIIIRLILMALIVSSGCVVCEKMTEESAKYYHGN